LEGLSLLEKDTIAEVGNISLGASATALSTILDKMVDITTPRLDVVDSADLQQIYPVPCLVVEVEYISGLEGKNVLLVKEQDAVKIAAMMMGESPDDKEGPLNEIETSAVQEAMNQMMGSMATSMSELFQRTIEISTPKIDLINLGDEEPEISPLNEVAKVVQVEFSMQVEEIIDSVMVQVIPLEFAKKMAAQLLGEEPEAASVPGENTTGPEADPGSDHQAEQADEMDKDAIETAAIHSGDQTGPAGPLSDLEMDTVGEVGNISLGASATALSVLLNKTVDITTPNLEVRKIKEIREDYPLPCLLVEVDYSSGLEGSNVLLIKEQDALVISALMMGESPGSMEGPMGEIAISAVQEAMNQMMGSMATSMSELFQRTIDITPPTIEQIDLSSEHSQLSGLKPEDQVVHVEFSIKVEDLIDSVMIQIIPVEFAKKMAQDLLYGQQEGEALSEAQPAVDPFDNMPDLEYAADLEEAVIDSQQKEKEPASRPAPKSDSSYGIDLQKLELIKDIPMDIEVVLGKARISLGKLFSLDKGGIVDLDCNVHDQVELMANNKLLAKGEVVMINDQLGIKITEIQFEEVIDSYDL